MSIINKFLVISFLLPSMGVASNLSLTPVEKLLMQHIEASGGEVSLIQMKSISRSGRISFYTKGNLNESYCYHTDILYPKKLREQIKGKEILYDRGTDGVSFWLWTGAQYEFTEDQVLMDYMSDTAERANRDLLWVKKESDHFKLTATPPSWAPSNSQCIQRKDQTKRTYCFDLSTGLLNSLGSSTEYRLESDWREVGNIKLPFHLTHYQNGVIIYEVWLDDAKLNDSVPDEQFIKPLTPQLNCGINGTPH